MGFIYEFTMTEYAGKSNEEMASAFITSTCQLLNPRSSLVYSDYMHNLMATNISEPKEYVIMCGSHAEFYIRPLLTCIEDMDFLIVRADELAFSGDFAVLPSEMSGLAENIECYKIEQCDRYPGFVRLRELGKMNYSWKHKEYKLNYLAAANI